ncbi:alpha-1,2-fucosyltransferase [Colwellia sp. 12G3]|uniref:alpha-1,2-fucosyltransferase n=1 Tax=Colwellia sp. 12G3 TaxID=2058299 RepID=UPI000C34516A|nr:alpha-1,2-fucosyltransferase [Colwellia sp. 12G3]PKI12857.1 alpha-1,2-fucosyltransferase [Colwellia sp. 12G3]
MKIVKVAGGFGNQLFQYAFYLALAKKHQEQVYLDNLDMATYRLHNGYELEGIFKLDANYCTTEQRSIVRKDNNVFTKLLSSLKNKLAINNNYILEPKREHFTFHEKSFGEANTAIYYKGYWQHAKYLAGIEVELKANLNFPEFELEQNIELSHYITESSSVSIHVRRGDYVQHKAFGGICDLSYYQRAVEKINALVENPAFIVFSDDIPWCKENLNLEQAKFVDWNSGDNSYRDMQLMSLCKHNIIANSSFSWWGAWLNANENKKVICPDKWVHYTKATGVLPSEWLKVKASA